MLLLVLALLLILALGGFGFAVHALWIAALVLFVLFIVGFFTGGGGWYGRW